MTTNLGVRAKLGGGTVTRCAIELGERSLKILQLGTVFECQKLGELWNIDAESS